MTITRLIEEHGDLPETKRAATGNGSHEVYQYPEGVEIRSTAGKLGEGLDVRGEGGYIVVAPSLHPNGRRYRWLNQGEPAELPGAFIDLITAKPVRPASTGLRMVLAEFTAAGPLIPCGKRNRGIFEILCALRGGGWEEAELVIAAKEIYEARCEKPPNDRMGDEELRAIAASAAKYATEAQKGMAPDASSSSVKAPAVALSSEVRKKE